MSAKTVLSSASIVPAVLLSLLWYTASLPCNDARCKTQSCDSSGACICDLPPPSSLLNGDRRFFGGKYCDKEMIMCDGSNEFWCENGGVCEEIVQGEEYRCRCPKTYGGDHCEERGVRCGSMYCFHGAECLYEDEACDCPSDWSGSSDCSLPTKPDNSSSESTKKGSSSHGGGSSNSSGKVVAAAVTCSVAAVAAGSAVYAKKWYGRKAGRGAEASGFYQLSRVQSIRGNVNGIGDENDPIVDGTPNADQSRV